MKIGPLQSKKVIHDFSSQLKNVLAQNQIATVPRRLILPAHLQGHPQLQPLPAQELDYEELEFLIEELMTIAEERCRKKMGFLPEPCNKEEVRLGEKAHELANKLLDEPKVEYIRKAKLFITANRVIEKLESIAHERNISTIGFQAGSNTEGNVKLANKATNFASKLKTVMNSKNIKSAIEFITLVDLIEELEDIGKEKGKGILGFHKEPQNENHEVIETMAFKLADVLKETPDAQTIQTALEFLQLVGAYDEAEFMQKQEKSINRNPCYGYHCSLEESMGYN